MNAVATRPCPHCQRRLIGRFTTRNGELVEEWSRCICEKGARPLQLQPDDLSYEERVQIARKTGTCMDCDDPVEGTKGKALRCGWHKRRSRLDRDNAARRTPEGARKRRRYERRRLRVKEVRERRNARRRELHEEKMANDSEYAAAYRRRKQRETSIKHPSYARRIEYFRRTNSDPERAERKREHARQRYYKLHPERPDPHCATCGEPIEWTPGKGRYCQTAECNPYYRREDEGVAA